MLIKISAIFFYISILCASSLALASEDAFPGDGKENQSDGNQSDDDELSDNVKAALELLQAEAARNRRVRVALRTVTQNLPRSPVVRRTVTVTGPTLTSPVASNKRSHRQALASPSNFKTPPPKVRAHSQETPGGTLHRFDPGAGFQLRIHRDTHGAENVVYMLRGQEVPWVPVDLQGAALADDEIIQLIVTVMTQLINMGAFDDGDTYVGLAEDATDRSDGHFTDMRYKPLDRKAGSLRDMQRETGEGPTMQAFFTNINPGQLRFIESQMILATGSDLNSQSPNLEDKSFYMRNIKGSIDQLRKSRKEDLRAIEKYTSYVPTPNCDPSSPSRFRDDFDRSGGGGGGGGFTQGFALSSMLVGGSGLGGF